MNVVFKCFFIFIVYRLQLRIEGITAFDPGFDTLLKWNWWCCVFVSTRALVHSFTGWVSAYTLACLFAFVCTVCVSVCLTFTASFFRLGMYTWKQHMHSVFPLCSKKADTRGSLHTAQSQPVGSFDSIYFTTAGVYHPNKDRKKLADPWKCSGPACESMHVCVHACSFQKGCVCALVWLFERSFYPIQEEAEFCVTLVWLKTEMTIKATILF